MSTREDIRPIVEEYAAEVQRIRRMGGDLNGPEIFAARQQLGSHLDGDVDADFFQWDGIGQGDDIDIEGGVDNVLWHMSTERSNGDATPPKATGTDVVAEVYKINPIAAMVVEECKYDLDLDGYEHPGEVIKDARGILSESGLDMSNWKTASKLSPDVVEEIMDGHPDVEGVAIILNVIGKYQIKNLTSDQIALSRTLLDEYAGEYFQGEFSLSDRVNLERIVGIIMRSDIEWANEHELEETVHDLLDYSKPITSTSWNGLMQALGRERREQLDRKSLEVLETEIASNEGRIRSWNSLVPVMKVEGESNEILTITPLINPLELQREGVSMSNCIRDGYGTEECFSGMNRIFSVRGNRGTKATIELEFHAGQWSASQVKGPHNVETSYDLDDVADELVKRYQKAWDNTSQSERTQKSWSGVGESSLGAIRLDDLPDDHISPTLRDAIADYRADQDAERDARVQDRAEEYRGMPAEQVYRARAGRGRLR